MEILFGVLMLLIVGPIVIAILSAVLGILAIPFVLVLGVGSAFIGLVWAVLKLFFPVALVCLGVWIIIKSF